VLLLGTSAALTIATAYCLEDAGMDFELISTGRYPSTAALRNCSSSAQVTSDAVRGDDPTLLTTLQRAVELAPEVVIVPAGLSATFFLSRHQHELPARNVFPVPELDLLERLNDKWRFGALLDDLGVAHPATVLVTDVADVESSVPEGRAVVKPLAAEGSSGIRVVDSRSEVADTVGRVAAAGLLPVLVQEHIPGDDMGVSVVADRGRVLCSIVQKYEGDGRVTFLERPDAVAMATTVIEATGTSGVFNFDLRRDERTDTLLMLECNPRNYASSHKSAYAGMNPVTVGIAVARGADIPPQSPQVGTLLTPVSAIKLSLTGRSEGLDPATRRGRDATLRNPVSSAIRLAEERIPWFASRVRGEATSGWVSFDAAEGRHSAW
jgi:predicted ATP-grasp superfamily ATP-dependent carboligase